MDFERPQRALYSVYVFAPITRHTERERESPLLWCKRSEKPEKYYVAQYNFCEVRQKKIEMCLRIYVSHMYLNMCIYSWFINLFIKNKNHLPS